MWLQPFQIISAPVVAMDILEKRWVWRDGSSGQLYRLDFWRIEPSGGAESSGQTISDRYKYYDYEPGSWEDIFDMILPSPDASVHEGSSSISTKAPDSDEATLSHEESDEPDMDRGSLIVDVDKLCQKLGLPANFWDDVESVGLPDIIEPEEPEGSGAGSSNQKNQKDALSQLPDSVHLSCAIESLEMVVEGTGSHCDSGELDELLTSLRNHLLRAQLREAWCGQFDSSDDEQPPRKRSRS